MSFHHNFPSFYDTEAALEVNRFKIKESILIMLFKMKVYLIVIYNTVKEFDPQKRFQSYMWWLINMMVNPFTFNIKGTSVSRCYTWD